jgi:ribosomal-protein-alanine N-acetyltransferase
MIWPLRPRAPSLRQLTPADSDSCARLHASGFARGWSASEFEALLRQRGASGVAAVSQRGALAGFVLVRAILDEAEILTLIVDRDHRGRGLGRDLMLDQLGRSAALGVRTFVLEVDETNAAAVSLYRRLGFETVGTRPSYYSGGAGASIMRLTL